MTNDEAIWLAGYLEGEGCFTWQKSYRNSKLGKREYRYPLIIVGCTDRDVTEKAATIMNSAKPFRVVRNQPGKEIWRTQIGGKRALAIMGVILPHMGKRRTEKILELFRLSAARPGTPRGERCYQAKLSQEAITEIRTSPRRFERGFKSEMMKRYGVCWNSIWSAANGLTWRDRPKEAAHT